MLKNLTISNFEFLVQTDLSFKRGLFIYFGIFQRNKFHIFNVSACNKERLDQVQKSGEELLKTKPEMSDTIQPKLDELSQEFDALQENTKEKGERLFDAKRADLYEQSCDDIDSFVTDLNRQIETEPVGNDLTSVNILMQKQQMIETQMLIKSQQVTELDSQADHLVR